MLLLYGYVKQTLQLVKYLLQEVELADSQVALVFLFC